MESHAQYSDLKMWKFLIKEKNINITDEMISYAKKYNNDKEVYIFMSKYK
jgi:hypothetical protein